MSNAVALIAPTGQTTLGEVVVPNWLTTEQWLTAHPEKRGVIELAPLLGLEAPDTFALVRTTLTDGTEEYYEAYLYGSATPQDGAHAGESLDLYAVTGVTVPTVDIPTTPEGIEND